MATHSLVFCQSFTMEFFIILLFLTLNSVLGKELFFTTPGGRNRYAGVYGGHIDTEKLQESDEFDLFQHGQYCGQSSRQSTFHTGLSITGVSYDPISKRALLTSNDRTLTTVYSLDVCASPPKCDKNAPDFYMDSSGSTDPSRETSLFPFGMYEGQIYFLTSRVVRNNRDYSHGVCIQLRKLDGCRENYPFTRSNLINIDSCSTHIVDVFNLTRYTYAYPPVFPADSMYIFKQNSHTKVLFLLHKQTRDEQRKVTGYDMDLIMIDVEEKQTSILHTEPVSSFSWAGYSMSNQGSIDYKDGTLCFSVIDKIVCADWDGQGSLTNTRTVLNTGDAYQVCKIDSSWLGEYSNVTTGVAIAETGDRLSIFFGCFAGVVGVGGMGLLQIPGGIKKIEGGDNPVYAGSIFLTDECPA